MIAQIGPTTACLLQNALFPGKICIDNWSVAWFREISSAIWTLSSDQPTVIGINNRRKFYDNYGYIYGHHCSHWWLSTIQWRLSGSVLRFIQNRHFFLLRKRLWKCRLRNDDHFVKAYICWLNDILQEFSEKPSQNDTKLLASNVGKNTCLNICMSTLMYTENDMQRVQQMGNYL